MLWVLICSVDSSFTFCCKFVTMKLELEGIKASLLVFSKCSWVLLLFYLYQTPLLIFAYLHIKAFTNNCYVAICFTNWHHTHLSYRLLRDFLTILFLSIAAVNDLMLMHLWVNALILSSNNLVTELFHLANLNLFIPFFLD